MSHGLCGLNEPFGHADFYPNGGNHQPGCGFFDLYCSHMRAVDLWIHSIKMPSCVFVTAFQVVNHSMNFKMKFIVVEIYLKVGESSV